MRARYLRGLAFAFRPCDTAGETKVEASPPMSAIWRTRFAAMWRTFGEAATNTVWMRRRHRAVHAGHLHLVVEVGAIAQAAEDDRRLVLGGGIDGEVGEGDDVDLGAGCTRDLLRLALQHVDALGGGEQRRLLRMHADADDELVDEPARPLDDVGVPERHGVEGTGVEADAFHGAGHADCEARPS